MFTVYVYKNPLKSLIEYGGASTQGLEYEFQRTYLRLKYGDSPVKNLETKAEALLQCFAEDWARGLSREGRQEIKARTGAKSVKAGIVLELRPVLPHLIRRAEEVYFQAQTDNSMREAA